MNRLSCWLATALWGLLACIAMLPGRADCQAFPLYDKYESLSNDDPTSETWVLYPLYVEKHTTNTLEVTVHPLFSTYRQTDSGRHDFDLLWPFYSFRYRPETNGAKNYRRYILFPFFYSKREERFNRIESTRMVLPFWFEGFQERQGRYKILFPFIWYAYNARLAVPLFPPRQQTFAAIFPLVGDFRGYWNRDRIAFFLWPLFVYSNEGKRGTPEFNEIHSFLWPIFSKYSGPKLNGFRIFPLISYVSKEGDYRRGFFLWPLGHYRQGRISKTDKEQQDVVMFLPFFAHFRRPNIKLDMIFPFYGKLETGFRVSEGYALAIYNKETNYRRGVREYRVLYFIFRKRVPMPGYTQEQIDPDATTGGGVFPFYTRVSSPKKTRVSYIWPLGHYKMNHYKEFDFERRYVFPFYYSQERKFKNGNYAYNRYFWPIYRTRKTLSDKVETNALHLFFYTYIGPLDRLYAPLWTFWEKTENRQTNESRVRYFKNAYIVERSSDGTVRRQWNFFFYKAKSEIAPDKSKIDSREFLFGLVGKEADGKRKLFWISY